MGDGIRNCLLRVVGLPVGGSQNLNMRHREGKAYRRLRRQRCRTGYVLHRRRGRSRRLRTAAAAAAVGQRCGRRRRELVRHRRYGGIHITDPRDRLLLLLGNLLEQPSSAAVPLTLLHFLRRAGVTVSATRLTGTYTSGSNTDVSRAVCSQIIHLQHHLQIHAKRNLTQCVSRLT